VFAPDGKSLVTIHASESGSSAVIWDTARWTTQVKPGFGSAAFSKDGKVLALGESNIELIDTASWKPIRTIKLPGLFALAYSPDGRTLAVGGVDGTVRLVRVDQ
jgi:WD40 repeat protein